MFDGVIQIWISQLCPSNRISPTEFLFYSTNMRSLKEHKSKLKVKPQNSKER